MSVSGKSYDKVDYEFRRAKQVERRMLLHAFQRLMEIGFPISSYQYTGMGSVWFIDFILFRRYLGIRRMVSVEGSYAIENRVQYNKPYGDVDIVMGDIADYIPSLSTDRKHILWLDFDFTIRKESIDAVVLGASQLSAGSFLLVTVDAEPPVKGDRPNNGGNISNEKEGITSGTRAKIGSFRDPNLLRLMLRL